MGFFAKIGASFQLIGESIKSISKYPILLLPIFLTWIVFALITVYLTYYATFPETDVLFYLYFLGIFWFITFVLTYTSAVMVGVVKQIETDGNMSIGKALTGANKNILTLGGLSLIWAIIWFLLVIIEAILSKAKKSNSGDVNYEGVARTLGGDGSMFSWLGLGLSVVKDLLRLSVFLAVPAILWKQKGVFSGIKEGGKVIGKHPVEFLGMYGSMVVIGILMAIPLAVVFGLADSGVEISDAMWMAVIVYEGIIWTFSIYIEQMSSTLLFLWHMKWEKENEGKAKSEIISISQISRPSLTDDIMEFEELNNTNTQEKTKTETSGTIGGL